MKKIKIQGILLLIISLMIVVSSCKKDFTNPAAATSDQVLSSAKGLTGLAVGLQRIYSAGRASSLYNRVTADGFITNQLVILNQGNTSEYQLQLGGTSVDGTNTIILGLWTSSNKIIHDADLVINNADNLADKSYASGLIAYATIFKALALGDLAMFWESVPDGTGTNVGFIPRLEGFNKALTALDNAISVIGTTPISASFLGNIPAGIDILNTLYALKARYSLFAGKYDEALAAANQVDLTKKSVFNFESANLNPIYETVTSTNNVYAVVDLTLGLPAGLRPDPNDKRLPFYVLQDTAAPKFKVNGFGAKTTTPWPVYLPGEIMLIKAEAYARMSTPDLANALVELNKVITKQPADDPFGVGAGLPPLAGPLTQQQILDEIYRQRSIELFMSGLRLEDERRFARPVAERKRNLFPYPFRERDNNPNTPADPAF
jgi:hypothetical protein